MITRLHILLEKGDSSGSVTLFSGRALTAEGRVDTDLRPGTYKLRVQRSAPGSDPLGTWRWVILPTAASPRFDAGLRFSVELDGPGPFTYAYADPTDLEVSVALTTDDLPELNPDEELLPAIGATAYIGTLGYVDDGILRGEYDVLGRTFRILYTDGSEITLDYAKLLPETPRRGGAMIDVFYRKRTDGRVYPRRFGKLTTPNIAAMVQEVEASRLQAESMQKLGRILLDFIQLGPRPLGVGPRGPAPAPRARILPRNRISPLNGTVNVGGGLEKGRNGGRT